MCWCGVDVHMHDTVSSCSPIIAPFSDHLTGLRELGTLLLTRGWRQVFDDLYKVKGEDATVGPQLSPCPLLSHILLQLDHIALGERQLVGVLPVKVEPRHASRTASSGVSNIQLV